MAIAIESAPLNDLVQGLSGGATREAWLVGIDLELTVWIADPLKGGSDVRSDLYGATLKAFRTAGISIPYPRQEVQLLATAETHEKPLNSGF